MSLGSNLGTGKKVVIPHIATAWKDCQWSVGPRRQPSSSCSGHSSVMPALIVRARADHDGLDSSTRSHARALEQASGNGALLMSRRAWSCHPTWICTAGQNDSPIAAVAHRVFHHGWWLSGCVTTLFGADDVPWKLTRDPLAFMTGKLVVGSLMSCHWS